MTTMESVIGLIAALFVAGGPITAYINGRALRQPKVTTAQAEQNEILTAAEDIDSRWKTFADEVQTRLLAENARLRAEVASLRAIVDILVNYANRLRTQIYRRKEPPPEDWPDGI